MEEVSAHHQRGRIVSLATLAEVVPSRGPRGDLRESLLLLAQLIPEATGEFGVTRVRITWATMRGVNDANRGQPVRSLDRQRAQTHRIQQLKDGRIGADAKC